LRLIHKTGNREYKSLHYTVKAWQILYTNIASEKIMKPLGETVTFSAEHRCWSCLTDGYDPAELSVRLISSHPVSDGKALLTSIAINGLSSAISDFRAGIRHAYNVARFDRFVTVPINNARGEAFASFLVNSKGTITNFVSSFSPFHFSVRMQEGREIWKIVLLGRRRGITKELLEGLSNEFNISDVTVHELNRGNLKKLVGSITLDSLDMRIVRALKSYHYLEPPHMVGLREMARGLNISPSTLSRRIRRIEGRVLDNFTHWYDFLYLDA
jgi:predicted DNA binding protein